jgi:two-component system chemotaxis response regulator CheB
MAEQPRDAPTKPLRVIVVDDSPICRGVLKGILEASGDIVVAAEAADGYEAIALAKELHPDLVTMDLDMPGVDGLQTIEILMAEAPVPILVVTGEPVGPGSELVFEAVNRGALDLLPKPSLSNRVQAEHVRRHVRTLAQVPVFQRISAARLEAVPVAQGEGSSPLRFPGSAPLHAPAQFVAIAAGAGGSRSVVRVLGRIPPDFPCPIVVAQHLPSGFVEAYAAFLRKSCELRIEMVGSTPVPCAPATVYLAPDGAHLVCEGESVIAVTDLPLGGYRPSATALFRSVASTYADRAVGVVLSGLGEDGGIGLGAMRDAGALTIAEDDHARPDEMPRAAVRAGAVERVMPVQLIGDMILASASPSQERQTEPPPA